MVVDLEEPRTPYPESRRASAAGRWPASSSTRWSPGELPLRVRPRAAAVDGPDAEGPPGRRRAEPRRRSCCRRSRARPTCTPPMRCSPAPRSTSASSAGSIAIYPILETAQAIRLAYEIATASPRVSRTWAARLAVRRHPPGARVPLDRRGRGDAVPALEGAGRRRGRRDPLPDQRHVGRRARRPRRAARVRHRSLRDLGYYGMMLGERRARAAGARGVHADGRRDRLLAGARPAGHRGRTRRHAARSVTATRARARPTSCTSPTSARPARTSPGPATSASSDVRSGGGDRADELEDPGGRQVLLEHHGAERSQRVGDGVAQRGGRADGTAFARRRGSRVAPCGGDSRWWISIGGISALVGSR